MVYRSTLLEPAGLAPPDDRRVARLALVARLAALGEHATRAARVPPARGAALAAAHRVIDRVHRRAAVVRLAAHVPLAAGLAERHVHVLGVADDADGTAALAADAADLAGGQRELRPLAFTGAEGRRAAGAAGELAAVAGLHLDVVDRHAQRDLAQRQAVADARLGVLAAHQLVADLQPRGR